MTSPADIFRDSVNSILNSMHTCLPAIVISYDHTTNKAVIQPALNKPYFSGVMSMPILNNVPILFPKNISFPIEQGDYVLLLFSERSIDLWLNEGGIVTPDDRRKFNLSDAIAIPGLKSFADDFSNNDGTSFKISFAGSKIQIEMNGDIQIETSNKIAIGSQAIELLQQISDTLAGIASITTTITVPAGGIPPTPFPIDNIATFTAIQAQIDSIKGLIT